MAPELVLPTLHVDEKLPSLSTKESDVYAFAMVAIEVLHTLCEHVQRLTYTFAYFVDRCSPVSFHSTRIGVTRRSLIVSCRASDPSGPLKQPNLD